MSDMQGKDTPPATLQQPEQNGYCSLGKDMTDVQPAACVGELCEICFYFDKQWLAQLYCMFAVLYHTGLCSWLCHSVICVACSSTTKHLNRSSLEAADADSAGSGECAAVSESADG